MPKRHQGRKRPADVIGTAVKVMRIVTGEEAEDQPNPKSAAAELDAKGSAASAKKLTKEQRAEIARKGAAIRHAVDDGKRCCIDRRASREAGPAGDVPEA